MILVFIFVLLVSFFLYYFLKQRSNLKNNQLGTISLSPQANIVNGNVNNSVVGFSYYIQKL